MHHKIFDMTSQKFYDNYFYYCILFSVDLHRELFSFNISKFSLGTYLIVYMNWDRLYFRLFNVAFLVLIHR